MPKSDKFFVPIVFAFYTAAIVLSFARVYILHAYPTYYSEDAMPGFIEMITDIPSLLTP